MCNIGQEILEQKSRSLRYKLRNSNSGKIDIFAKGLTSGIGQKWPILNLFFLGNIGQENVVYDILERKRAFFNLWFWSKNGYFSQFFFLDNIGIENVFYDILERNNVFLGYKKKKFKKSKNSYFSQGVNQWYWPKMAILKSFF